MQDIYAAAAAAAAIMYTVYHTWFTIYDLYIIRRCVPRLYSALVGFNGGIEWNLLARKLFFPNTTCTWHNGGTQTTASRSRSAGIAPG